VDSDVQSDLQSGWGAESILGMESNMSYAYSLEDGINHTVSADFPDHPVPSVIGRMPSMESERNDENDDLDIDKDFLPTASSILREITAPPGKLGLVLNTSDRGPVVQEVASGSPLEGMVWPGDVIISIDDIKTKKMSADQVTQYMTENLFKKRRLTVLSDGRA
jgi:S1-C subfamily serine protease